jgi:integrase
MALQMARPFKHPRSGVYYFRQRTPTDLRPKLGNKIVSRSLHTKDPAIAKVRNAEEVRKQALIWDAHRKQPEPLSSPQIVALSGIVYRDLMALRESEPGEPEIWSETLNLLDRISADPETLNSWYSTTVDNLLLERGIVTDNYSRSRLITEAHKALRQASEQQLRRAEGDYSPDPKANRFPSVAGTATPTPHETTTIRGLFKLWERDHLADGKSARTVGDFRQKIESLVTFVGHDSAEDVTPENISDWCEKLRHDQNLSPKTVSQKYLATAKLVFGIAVEKRKLKVSPAKDVTVRFTKKKRRARPKGFTDDEARTILRASLQDKGLENWSEANRLAVRWGPWICAFTGARITEIMQLRREDLIHEADIPCLRITPDAGSVKSGNFRVVPLHPQLQALGLVQMIEARSNGPIFFQPRLKTAAQQSAENAGAKVGKWVRQIVGIADRRLQPNHAWRHRFKTLARDMDIDPEYRDAIQGHEDGRAASDYGETTVKALYREIQKLPRYETTESDKNDAEGDAE